MVYVQDDGVDPRYVDRLFGAFQRLHDEKEFQGIGMGLVNVRRIIERHGGSVWAEGHPGDGATFYVRLPGDLQGTLQAQGTRRNHDPLTAHSRGGQDARPYL